MNLIKKSAIFLLLISMILISSASYAFSSSDCAKDGETIAALDYSICENDISFRIYYDMFPDVLENSLFTFYEFEYLKNLKDDPLLTAHSQHLKFSLLFQDFFDLFFEISLVVVAAIMVHFAITGILRTMESGRFLGDEKETKGVYKSAFFTSIFLVPVGNVFVIQIVVMALTLTSISLANYAYGYYLSSIDHYSHSYTKQSYDEIVKSKSMSHNKVYAQHYANNLIGMSLCRDVTAQYSLNDYTSVLGGDELFNQGVYACLSPDLTSVNMSTGDQFASSGFTTENSFLHIGLSEFQYIDNWQTKVGNTVNFAATSIKSCDVEYYKDYNCGTMSVLVPKPDDNFTLNVLVGRKLNKLVDSVVSSINLANPSGNRAIIFDGWETLRGIVNDEWTKVVEDPSVVDYASQDYWAVRNLTAANKSAVIKDASYVYHQLVSNYLHMGYVEMSQTLPSDRKISGIKYYPSATLSANSKVSPLLSNMSTAQSLSRYVQEYHCMKESSTLLDSRNYADKLANDGSASKYSARCIDYVSGETLGLSAEEPFENSEDRNEAMKAINAAFKAEYDKYVELIYKNKVAVEHSFLESVNDRDFSGLISGLRQQGWLTLASYMIELNKNVNIVSGLRTQLINSVMFNMNYNSKYIADDIYIDGDDKNDIFEEFMGANYLLNAYAPDLKALNNYVNFGNVSESIYRTDKSQTESLTMMSNFTSSPFTKLKNALGVYDDAVLLNSDVDYAQLCADSPDKCPIPKVNPFIKLNELGNHFLNTSTAYFSAVIVSSVAIKSVTVINKSSIFNFENGKGNKGGGIGNSNAAKTNKGNKIARAASKFLSSATSFLTYPMILMFIGGVFLAYVIPLLPFIYFMMAFLSWFLLAVMLLFVSPIWAAYLLKFSDSKQEIQSFALNHGMRLLLKPLLMVLSMIFIWNFYTAVIFFVNLTIFPLFSSIHQEGIIMSVISNVLIVMLFAYVLFLFTYKIFSYFDNIFETIFDTLGVQTKSDDKATADDVMQAVVGFQLFNMATDKMKTSFTAKDHYGVIKDHVRNRRNKLAALQQEHKGKKTEKQILKIYNDEINDKKNKSIYGRYRVEE
jgi:conjugal transfer/type IV secretion protein DotA/TraY